MLYDMTPVVEQVGLVRFRHWKVMELDSWGATRGRPGPGLVRPRRADVDDVLSRMAIIVPIRDERVKFLEGVLAGIPRGVRVIVVSNSARGPVDRFHVEQQALESLSMATGREVTLVHQRDPALGAMLEKAGYTGLLDDEGLVCNGKGESMAVGVLLALAGASDYIGFMDSDNYVPGAVLEHVLNYAAGFAQNQGDQVCVREIWHFKPKFDDEVRFNRSGRCSRVTNAHLNRLVASLTGFETEQVRTGNAGEHALTRALAMEMPLASGYAVETWELRWMLERWAGILDTGVPGEDGVDVVQIETANPHLHENKGSDHILDMIAASLGVIYHSPLADETVRAGIETELSQRGWTDDIPVPNLLPAPTDGDLDVVARWLETDRDQIVVQRREAPLTN